MMRISLIFLTHVVMVGCCFCGIASAQNVTLINQGQYRPGEYLPIKIESQNEGLVRIRADDSLGIDWIAPGKTSITTAWMTWRETPGDITIEVNGKKQTLTLQPLTDSESYRTPNPFAYTNSESGVKRPGFSQNAYQPAYAWPGGRSAESRRWIVIASILVVLILAAIQLSLWRSRYTPWVMLVAGGALTLAIISMPRFNQPVARAILIVPSSADARYNDVWVYLRSDAPTTANESWSSDTLLIPRSPAHLASLSPVVHLNADASAGTLELTLAPRATACVLHRHTGNMDLFAGDRIESPSFIRTMYGQRK